MLWFILIALAFVAFLVWVAIKASRSSGYGNGGTGDYYSSSTFTPFSGSSSWTSSSSSSSSSSYSSSDSGSSYSGGSDSGGGYSGGDSGGGGASSDF